MRVDGKCQGDCGSCHLLANGQVDMVPCVLDQIFQRIQRLEIKIESINNKGKKRTNIAEAPDKTE